MSKKSKKKEKEKISKVIDILGAKIKDGFCNYKYKINIGIGAGDTIDVDGVGIVDDDMYEAFRKFHAHLAAIDDMFKHSNTQVESIDKMHNNALTALYSVSGFKIKGTGENERISLIGEKIIDSTGERMTLSTPYIPLDKHSSYVWYAELKEAADDARNEVELYKGGKCTPVEPSESKDPAQLKIGDNEDMDFEGGRL